MNKMTASLLGLVNTLADFFLLIKQHTEHYAASLLIQMGYLSLGKS